MSNARDLSPCPYFGLQPATERDAEYFFGRVKEQQIIKNNLLGPSLTVLYGASGVGKSSLLLAAVAPQMRKPGRAVVVFRQYQDDDLADSLKRAVLEAVREGTPGGDVDMALPLDDFLLECNNIAQQGVFIILDQFESYFLHHPPSPATSQFESQLARAVNRQDIDVHLLLALREDRLSTLDRFQGRINVFQNLLRVEPMSRAAAEDAIRKPLAKYNEQHPGGGPVTIQDELVAALLDDVSKGQTILAGRGARAGEQIDTPSLQLVLSRLWEEEMAAGSRKLRLATYNSLGHAERIIGKHLDGIMEVFDKADRRLAARMFRYLVTPAGVKVAHTAADLAEYTEQPVKDVERVLDGLCEQPGVRVLQRVAPLPGQPDAARYEIFHDVLGPAVYEWQSRYRALVREGEVRDKERAKRLLVTVAVMGVALIAMIATTYFAVRQRNEAQRQFERAERQSRSAEQRRAQAEESERRALAAEAKSNALLASEQAATLEATQQAEKANKAKQQAEQEKNRADDEKNKAVKAREEAVKAQKEAVEAQKAEKRATEDARKAEKLAEGGYHDAVLRQLETEEARQEAEAAKLRAEKAAADEKIASAAVLKANAATRASIKQVQMIDRSVPFAEGVIRNTDTQQTDTRQQARGDVRGAGSRRVGAVYTPEAIITSDKQGHVLFWETSEVTKTPDGALPKKSEEFIPVEKRFLGADLKTVLSRDGKRAATADSNKVYVWEPSPAATPEPGATPAPSVGRLIRTLTVPAQSPNVKINSLALTTVDPRLVAEGIVKDRDLVAAGTVTGHVFVWDLKQCGQGSDRCEPVLQWQPHEAVVNSIAFSPDGRFIATGSGRELTDKEREKAEKDGCESVKTGDTSVTVWQSWPGAPGGREPFRLKELKDHRCRVNSVAFNHPDFRPPYKREDKAEQLLRLVTASDDGTARAWNIVRITGPERGPADGWKEVDTDVYTLNVYEAPRVRFWLLRQPLRKFFSYSLGLKDIKRIEVPVYSAAFSPVDHNIVVTAGEEGALRVWDVASSSTVRVIQGQYGVRNIAFSDDGRFVVSAGDDDTVRLWNICKDTASNAKRSVIANLTTDDALLNLEQYCGKVEKPDARAGTPR